jgi:hypothetical protein
MYIPVIVANPERSVAVATPSELGNNGVLVVSPSPLMSVEGHLGLYYKKAIQVEVATSGQSVTVATLMESMV